MNIPLTPAEQILLGLLAEQSRHGYELEQVITKRGIREWTELGFSSIYYLISKLATNKLLTVKTSNTRKVYSITPKGLQAARVAAEHSLVQLTANHSPVLVGLANSPLLDQATVIALLRQRQEKIAEQLSTIKTAKNTQMPVPDFVEAIFDYSIRQLAAEAVWCEKTIKQLKDNAMEKIDFKKTLPKLYSPKNKTWEMVTVPALNFLMIDGAGNPNTAKAYRNAVEALYSVAYPLKFMSKKQLRKDYTVSALEGLWYADDMNIFTAGKKDAYKWTMMIMQPKWITRAMVQQAIAAAKKKKPGLPYEKLRFENYHEGRALQLLHSGSYDDEAPKLQELHHELMPAQGLKFNGHHHEIYLSDPRKVAANKLKTILRQPVTNA